MSVFCPTRDLLFGSGAAGRARSVRWVANVRGTWRLRERTTDVEAVGCAGGRRGAPSSWHPAELLGGIQEQRLNLLDTAPIDGAELPPLPTGLVEPHTLSAQHIDRIFGTDGARTLAEVGEPEIGVGVVRRPRVEVEVELNGDLHRLKFCIAPLDAGDENLPDPVRTHVKGRGGIYRSRPIRGLRALAVGMLASIHVGVIECWHVQLPAVNWVKQRRHPKSRISCRIKANGQNARAFQLAPPALTTGGLGACAPLPQQQRPDIWRGGMRMR